MKYRPEIDGLRAVAVAPVVLYHAGVDAFGGGFVGVDIFFVISGFLITGLIWPEVRERRFSIVKFYERRARRILPALVVVAVFSALCAHVLFANRDYEDFAQSLSATALFSSNILFWIEGDYFAAPAEVKPLLHTWSLAVEEQFYILFPLLLLAVGKFLRAHIGAVVIFCLAASFALSGYLVDVRPTSAFYLLHARAWELMIGASLALGLVPRPIRPRTAEILAIVGLVLIAASVFGYDATTPFPGFAALLPCLGAFLVIHANAHAQTVVGRWLSLSPIVGIGLISYSLYLWHWPLIVFAKYLVARPLTGLETTVIVVASVMLAMISWRFVEQPFRGRSSAFDRAQVFTGAAAATFVLAFTGGMANLVDQMPLRSAPTTFQDEPHERSELCLDADGVEQVQADSLCTFGSAEDRLQFIVWGDSHADALFPLFNGLAEETETHGVIAAEPGCPPLLGITRPTQPFWPDGSPYNCRAFNDAVLEYVIDKDIRNIFLVARWTWALGRHSFELATMGAGAQVLFGDDLTTGVSVAENLRAFSRGLNRTLQQLSQDERNVWLVLQAPSPGFRVPQYLTVRARVGNIDDVRREFREGMERHRIVRDQFSEIAERYGTTVLDPADVLCMVDECLIALGGQNLYFDDDHVSTAGASLFGEMFRPIFENF